MSSKSKTKRIVQGRWIDGGKTWVGYDTKYNPYGKVVIKDENGKVTGLQG